MSINSKTTAEVLLTIIELLRGIKEIIKDTKSKALKMGSFSKYVTKNKKLKQENKATFYTVFKNV